MPIPSLVLSEDDTESFEGMIFGAGCTRMSRLLTFESPEVENLFVQHHFRSHWPILLMGCLGNVFLIVFLFVEEEYQQMPYVLLYIIPAVVCFLALIVFCWSLLPRYGAASRLERCRMHEVMCMVFVTSVASPIVAGAQLAIDICAKRAPTPSLRRDCYYMLEPYIFTLMVFPLVFTTRQHFLLIFNISVLTIYTIVEFGLDIGTPVTESFNRILLTVVWACSTTLVGYLQEKRARRTFAGLIALHREIMASKDSQVATETVLCSLVPRAQIYELSSKGGIKEVPKTGIIVVVSLRCDFGDADRLELLTSAMSALDFAAQLEGVRRVGVFGIHYFVACEGGDAAGRTVRFCGRVRDGMPHGVVACIGCDFGSFVNVMMRSRFTVAGRPVQIAHALAATAEPGVVLVTRRLDAILSAESIQRSVESSRPSASDTQIFGLPFVKIRSFTYSGFSVQMAPLEAISSSVLRRGVLRILETMQHQQHPHEAAAAAGQSVASIDQWIMSSHNPLTTAPASSDQRSASRTSSVNRPRSSTPNNNIAAAGRSLGDSNVSVGPEESSPTISRSVSSRKKHSTGPSETAARGDDDGAATTTDDLEFLHFVERKLEKRPGTVFAVGAPYVREEVQIVFEEYALQRTMMLRMSAVLSLNAFILVGIFTTGISAAFEPLTTALFSATALLLIVHIITRFAGGPRVTLFVTWMCVICLFFMTLLHTRPAMAITNVTSLWVVSSITLHLNLTAASPLGWIANQLAVAALFTTAYVIASEWWFTTIGLVLFLQCLMFSVYKTLLQMVQSEFEASFKAQRVISKLTSDAERLQRILDGLVPRWAVAKVMQELPEGTAFSGPPLARRCGRTLVVMANCGVSPLRLSGSNLSVHVADLPLPVSAFEVMHAKMTQLIDVATSECGFDVLQLQGESILCVSELSDEEERGCCCVAAERIANLCSTMDIAFVMDMLPCEVAVLRMQRLVIGSFSEAVVALEKQLIGHLQSLHETESVAEHLGQLSSSMFNEMTSCPHHPRQRDQAPRDDYVSWGALQHIADTSSHLLQLV